MFYRPFAACALMLAVAVLPACQTRTVTTADSNLTVSGPTEAVERFASLQTSRTPAYAAGTLKPIGPNTAEIEIILDESATGDDVVQIGREAIAAGLTYSFSSSRTTATTTS